MPHPGMAGPGGSALRARGGGGRVGEQLRGGAASVIQIGGCAAR